MEGLEADGRIDAHHLDLLGRLGGDLLDVHAAFGRGHERDPRGFAIDHHAEIEFARDVAAVFDEQASHLPAFRAGLVGHQRHAEHIVGELAHLLDRFGELDAAAFAAAACVNLRFDHPERTAQLLGRGLGFFGRVRDLAAQHADAVLLKERFRLIFVNIHR